MTQPILSMIIIDIVYDYVIVWFNMPFIHLYPLIWTCIISKNMSNAKDMNELTHERTMGPIQDWCNFVRKIRCDSKWMPREVYSLVRLWVTWYKGSFWRGLSSKCIHYGIFDEYYWTLCNIIQSEFSRFQNVLLFSLKYWINHRTYLLLHDVLV